MNVGILYNRDACSGKQHLQIINQKKNLITQDIVRKGLTAIIS